MIKKPLFILLILFTTALVVYFSEPKEPTLTQSEKVALEKRFITDPYIMPDTLIDYTIYSDSIVFEFKQPAHYKYWDFELSLTVKNNTTRSTKHYALLENIPVIKNKMVVTAFHIAKDSISTYEPEIFGFPVMEDDSQVISKEIGDARMFFKDHQRTGTLHPWGKQLSLIALKKNAEKQLQPHEKEYLNELFEKKFN